MKERLSLEERNPQKMRWSNVVKRHRRTERPIVSYVLTEISPTQPTEDPHCDEKSAVPADPHDQGFIQGEAYRKGQAEGYAQGHTEGYVKGREEGFAEGQAEGKRLGQEIREEELAEYEKTHQLLLRLVDDLKTLTETIVLEAENDLLQISISVAQKILRKEITQNPETILEYVQEALKNVGPTETALIRTHPQDLELLTRKRPELLQAVEGMKLLKFEPDPKLLPGDCIVESPDRMIDARLDSQLALIEKKLLHSGEGENNQR